MPVNTFDDFKNAIDELTSEWAEAKGEYITCEISTSGVDLDKKMKYIHEATKKISEFGYWQLYYCSTCASNNPDNPFHVEIVYDTKETREEEHLAQKVLESIRSLEKAKSDRLAKPSRFDDHLDLVSASDRV